MSTNVTSHLDFGGAARLLNLPAPVDSAEPVRLADLNAAVEGVKWKNAARVATQANLNLASPGATVDGVALTSGDRVLVRNQTAAAENGIYIWNGAATPMTRALDASTAAELENAVVLVVTGTDAGISWRQTATSFVLDTDPVAWTHFASAIPPASEATPGLAEVATQAETDAGTDDTRIVTPLKLATYSGRALRYSASIGDGSSTQYDVTHNFGTRDVQVEVYRGSGNYDTVLCDVSRPSVNAVRLNFASAPTVNQFRVVVTA